MTTGWYFTGKELIKLYVHAVYEEDIIHSYEGEIEGMNEILVEGFETEEETRNELVRILVDRGYEGKVRWTQD